MNRDEAIQEMMDSMDVAARLYGIPDTDIDRLQDELGGQHFMYRAGTVNGQLTSLVTRIAYAHKLDCTSADCVMCDHIREALTVAVASSRISEEKGRGRRTR